MSRKPIFTAAQAGRRRRYNIVFAMQQATHIASIVGHLRAHARRCRTEKGYVTPGLISRYDCVLATTGLAEKLQERVRLRLSVQWWLAQAEALLEQLDKLNSRRELRKPDISKAEASTNSGDIQ